MTEPRDLSLNDIASVLEENQQLRNQVFALLKVNKELTDWQADAIKAERKRSKRQARQTERTKRDASKVRFAGPSVGELYDDDPSEGWLHRLARLLG